LLRGGDESLTQRMRFTDIGDGERPAHPVQRVLAASLVLGATKIGQHILKTPAGIAELAPMIEILRLTADVQETIDRARPTQHFPARLDDAPVVELGFRLGGIERVRRGLGEQLAVSERDVNPDVPVVTAGFEQQNALASRGGQAIGEHAAGRASAYDDIVEGVRMRLHRRASSADPAGAAWISRGIRSCAKSVLPALIAGIPFSPEVFDFRCTMRFYGTL